ncbi:unnamed protein product [Effrenium voratum]|nr:unnamed protein product [Effrenium voratum]
MRPKRPKVGQPCDHEQCQVHFNDSHWELLDVPHDFVVAGNFSPHADKSHGYLPYKVGWYRKRLCLNVEEMQGWLEFEGVMVRSQVWLNGEFLGDHFSGYTPRLLDISQVTLKSGCENLLAVRADATSPDGWWYDGGGIYRHVWLTSVAPVHIAPFGLYTPAVVVGKIDRTEGLEYADAEVRPTVELVNQHNTSRNVHVECSISDGGKFVTSKDFDTSLAAGASLDLALPHMPLPGAKLWSPRNPALYVMTVRIWGSDHSPGALPDDEVRVTFGVRQLSWSADTGFSINGVATKILGTANHQDVAVLGVAVPDHLQAYRLEMLQKVGANAWRTAHNPPSVALLDAADRLGVMVWDENHRNGQDSEMEVMVRRDRNHPSIIIWSVCNENLCHSDHVVDDARRLQDLAHRLDPLMGRLVSANYNEFNGNKTPMDLMGFDYGPEMYDRWHAEAPWKPSISSETSSAYSDRGLVQNDPKTGHVRDYDTEHPSWGQTAQVAWQAILRRPFVAGGFTWTGWDYRGEPTPYAWPDVSSHFGILDMAGFWQLGLEGSHR